MRRKIIKKLLILGVVALGACAHQNPGVSVADAPPAGTAVVVLDPGHALIYRVETRGHWQVYANARQLEALGGAAVRAVDQADLQSAVLRTADALVAALRHAGLPAERADHALTHLPRDYAHALVLEVQRAGVAQAGDGATWPHAVYEISAQWLDLQAGEVRWRTTAAHRESLALAGVVERAPDVGINALRVSAEQSNRALLQQVLAQLGQREVAAAF